MFMSGNKGYPRTNIFGYNSFRFFTCLGGVCRYEQAHVLPQHIFVCYFSSDSPTLCVVIRAFDRILVTLCVCKVCARVSLFPTSNRYRTKRFSHQSGEVRKAKTNDDRRRLKKSNVQKQHQ